MKRAANTLSTFDIDGAAMKRYNLLGNVQAHTHTADLRFFHIFCPEKAPKDEGQRFLRNANAAIGDIYADMTLVLAILIAERNAHIDHAAVRTILNRVMQQILYNL